MDSETYFAFIFKMVQTPGCCMGGGDGGGGYSDIFIHTYGLDCFFIQSFEIQYFWGVQKNTWFWGYEEVVDILGDHYIIGLIWGSFLYILGFFLKARHRMGTFLGVKKFQIFIWEYLILLIFLLGNQ